MNEYQEEIARLGSLAPVAVALIEYAKALVPGGGEFVKKTTMWVSKPNFVAFSIPKRSRQVIFSVYGSKADFKTCKVLITYPGSWRSSYREFRLASPRQLGAAASYIATSFHRSMYKRKRSDVQLAELHEIL